MFKTLSAALAVDSLLQMIAGKVYLNESFPENESYQERWVYPNDSYLEPSSRRFYFQRGDTHDSDSFVGLFARDPDARYAISTWLTQELDPA